MYKGSLFIPT